MFCSWDAEEFGLIGSTEWVEEFEKKLLFRAVTYVNIDISVQGDDSMPFFICIFCLILQ